MTAQEAINELQYIKAETYDYYAIAALDVAIESVRKHIPMKPRMNKGALGALKIRYNEWTCPQCDSWYEGFKYKHCPNCGQAIDWSDE